MSGTREGVIKFHLDFEPGPAPEQGHLVELDKWRDIFRQHGLIGQDPQRYEGLGFGNLSRRLPGGQGDAFLISGTQTGHLLQLLPKDYSTVTRCDPGANRLAATGQTRPSSEALSHGVLYQYNRDIEWVMHLHSPEIFNRYLQLDLPFTDPAADYGTPEMAAEISRLAENHDCLQPGLIIMAGHLDGVLAFGRSADATGELVLATLKKANAL